MCSPSRWGHFGIVISSFSLKLFTVFSCKGDYGNKLPESITIAWEIEADFV
jgi:hypothetical protein